MIIYVYVPFPWFPFTCEISQGKKPWVARFRWQADARLPRPLAWLKTIQVGAEYVENAKKNALSRDTTHDDQVGGFRS